MANLKKVERRQALEHFYCVVCGGLIPSERVIRKSVTCTEQHAKVLKLERRRLRDVSRCRLCNRPSSPEERADFAAWRKANRIKPGPKPKTPEELAAAREKRKLAAAQNLSDAGPVTK